MIGIAYDPTRKSLYQPSTAEDFFQLAPLSSEAVLCAEMARLAYVKQPASVEDSLQRVDFEPLFFVGYEVPNGTQLFACRSRDSKDGCRTIVVSFRGTEPDDPSDLATDANLVPELWLDESGRAIGKVHRGFAQAILEGNGQASCCRLWPGACGPCVGNRFASS